MTRLLVQVEGETEEDFVREVLEGHLFGHGISSVNARLIGKGAGRNRRGGIRRWPTAQEEIVRRLREDRNCIVTTMVDYYGLPKGGPGSWPNRGKASQGDASQRAETIEDGMSEDVRREMGSSFDSRRFVPYVMMHEFEAMLFSDCEKFCSAVEHPDLLPEFQKIRDGFSNPEEIDDFPTLAPSKRIETLIEGYDKRMLGNLAALEIGLPRIREECPHFARWLFHLERLPGEFATG